MPNNEQNCDKVSLSEPITHIDKAVAIEKGDKTKLSLGLFFTSKLKYLSLKDCGLCPGSNSVILHLICVFTLRLHSLYVPDNNFVFFKYFEKWLHGADIFF